MNWRSCFARTTLQRVLRNPRSRPRLTERFPTLRLNLLRTFTAHLAELEERFREMATERVSLRVARQFLRLAEKIGQAKNGPVDICLSRGSWPR
jgi:CRP-like cAMP-binding protein